MKKKLKAKVLSQRVLTEGIMDLRLHTGFTAGEFINPGQFVGVYTGSEARLLPRPISICEAYEDKADEGLILRLVYRIAGQGTAEFALLQPGMSVMLLGILGNGFPVGAASGRHALVIGGGIGIPPLLQLVHELHGDTLCGDPAKIAHTVTPVLGYRGGDLFLADEFGKYSDNVLIATEDGSSGTKGNVLDAIREEGVKADVIYACGPTPMLKGIKAYSEEKGIPAYISLEERMACGVGVCLGCVCNTTEEDPHSHVHNARICADGPVFEAGKVVL